MSVATIIKFDSPDASGLVARITGCIAQHGGNLIEVSQYTDIASRWFFARLAVEGTPSWRREAFAADFARLAADCKANCAMHPTDYRMPTVIMVSKQDHCLADLLWRWRAGELPIDIRAVVANHDDCRAIVERENIPFHKIDFTAFPPADKETAFSRAAAIIHACGAELVVLARFMQILPSWLCDRYRGSIINIHHSFLPAFVGANPYRRAFERGVKLIGATCHYATQDLDAGPIIDQQVIPVEHYHDPDDLSRLGRDCERLALARGVRYHAQGRVLIHGTRAIVFRD